MFQSLSKKLFLVPRKAENQLLSEYYSADQELVSITQQIKKLDAEKQADKVSELISQLKAGQQKVMRLMTTIMNDYIPGRRHSRDFRVKFPDEVVQDGLEGQLWYASECLAAGSTILYREVEAESIRPLAVQVTKEGEKTRRLLRDEACKGGHGLETKRNVALLNQLEEFDHILAEFELSYVSAMVAVKTMTEMEQLQEVAVLFSETVSWALTHGYISREDLESCDPSLMVVLPRLAVLVGMRILDDGPLNPNLRSPEKMCVLFKSFHTHLSRMHAMLAKLTDTEFDAVVRELCLTEMQGDDEPTSSTASRRRVKLANLFKVISGVADQIQSNHAWELRYLLRCVYAIHCSSSTSKTTSRSSSVSEAANNSPNPNSCSTDVEEAVEAMDWQVLPQPQWVPDDASSVCTAPNCDTMFSFTRRRHHCRCCGGLFCGKCSAYSRSLPRYGYSSPVRVCFQCFECPANPVVLSVSGPSQSSSQS